MDRPRLWEIRGNWVALSSYGQNGLRPREIDFGWLESGRSPKSEEARLLASD